MKVLVGLSGKISSGKSSLATALAVEFNCPIASFGNFVRQLASQKEMEGARTSLQELGQSLVEGNCEQFCKDVISSSGWSKGQSLVIDGIRHVLVLEKLKQLLHPHKILLVVVETPDDVRSQRNKMKDVADLAELDNHAVESDSKELLPKIANLRLNGLEPLDKLVSMVVSLVDAES